MKDKEGKSLQGYEENKKIAFWIIGIYLFIIVFIVISTFVALTNSYKEINNQPPAPAPTENCYVTDCLPELPAQSEQ